MSSNGPKVVFSFFTFLQSGCQLPQRLKNLTLTYFGNELGTKCIKIPKVSWFCHEVIQDLLHNSCKSPTCAFLKLFCQQRPKVDLKCLCVSSLCLLHSDTVATYLNFIVDVKEFFEIMGKVNNRNQKLSECGRLDTVLYEACGLCTFLLQFKSYSYGRTELILQLFFVVKSKASCIFEPTAVHSLQIVLILFPGPTDLSSQGTEVSLTIHSVN